MTETKKTPAGEAASPRLTRDEIWQTIPPWERVSLWEKEAPGTAKELLRLMAAEARHRHRLDFLGIALGFGAVLVLAGVAWHYADLGQAVAGASFASVGMAATVASFVTGKYIGRNRGDRQ